MIRCVIGHLGFVLALSGSAYCYGQSASDFYEAAVAEYLSHEQITSPAGFLVPVKFVFVVAHDNGGLDVALRVTKQGLVERRVGNRRKGFVPIEVDEQGLAVMDRFIAQPPQEQPTPDIARRLLIAYATEAGIKRREYDRARLPPEVASVIRTVQSDFKSFGAKVLDVPLRETKILGSAGYHARFQVSPRDDSLAFASRETGLLILTPGFRQAVPPIPLLGGVHAAEFSPDGRFFAVVTGGSSSRGGDRAAIYDTSKWTKVCEVVRKHPQSMLRRIQFSPTGVEFTLWTADLCAETYVTANGRSVENAFRRSEFLQLSGPAGDALLTFRWDESSWLTLADKSPIRLAPTETRCLKAAFAPNGKSLALLFPKRLLIVTIGSSGCEVDLRPYDVGWSERELWYMPWLSAAPAAVPEPLLAWSPDSQFLIASCASGTHIWNADSGRHCASLSGRLAGVGFDRSGTQVYAASSLESLELYRWDITDLRKEAN